LSSLPHDARKRLKALEDFSDLGSGFQIAMQDLDIRGAGNLLGAEQSGFIADIGIENFHRILNETIQELKENEFREVFEGENVTQNDSLIKAFTNECSVETDLELYLPETYVQSSSERIKLYRNLDNIENEEELSVFETEILDRFGQIPPESKGLFDVVRLRWDAIKIGVERITLRSEVLVLYFVPQEHSGFYRSETFSAVLRYIEMNPKYCKVNTNKERMSLVFMKTKGITQAREVVKAIKAS
jgi:transcription-repair coupling factor (superfamily II helicase)